ncbi:MAG: hypothetical protein CMJ83_11560 [Planctomycetes bacterium]|nr:hypothetical protein [Planctomycetota bacterium]
MRIMTLMTDGADTHDRPDPPAESGPAGLLGRVDIVLVEPRGPRNIGSTARAMRNFGLSSLHVINGPPLDHPEAVMMAVNAGGLLRRASTHDALEDAIADATFVVGTTAKRRYRLPTLRPREAAERLIEEAARGRVAILFGREDHGLDGEELRHAHATVAIETAPECRALNISQAVLLLAYELWLAADASGVVADSNAGRLLTSQMRERLGRELVEAMTTVGMLHDGNEIPLVQSIERILALGPMQSRDARVLFALARRVQNLLSDGPQSGLE